ncbi:MAG: hypothetical protein FJ379_10995 [Verrucomicrobia bacterium]|nr:hypothetical protein [Verrucomicrobiota bacterium]
MYRIIGGDGNEYGPVTAEQMRQWITENRVNGETRVQGADGVWKTLREFPEFSEILSPPLVAHLPPVQGLPVDFDGDYQLDIGGCLGSGWRVMRSQFGLALGVGLVFMGIQVALALLGAIPFIGTIFSLGAWVITGPLMGGLVFFYLRMVRGESPELGNLFDGFRRSFGQLFLGQLVPGLLAFIPVLPGMVVLLIGLIPVFVSKGDAPTLAALTPGLLLILLGFPVTLYLQTSWMFTLPLILDQGLDFWTAMGRSRRQVGLHWWLCFGLTVVVGLVNLVGVLCCVVGVLVSFPLGILALMQGYEAVIHGREAR